MTRYTFRESLMKPQRQKQRCPALYLVLIINKKNKYIKASILLQKKLIKINFEKERKILTFKKYQIHNFKKKNNE